MPRLIHIADVHASKERIPETMTIIKKLIDTSNEENVDAILFCGDFWDTTITNTRSSGFSETVRMMHRLIDTVPVYMIYGTPSHEPDGSLEVFREMGATVSSEARIHETPDLAIAFVPEPRMAHFKEDSLEDKYNAFHDGMKHLAESLSKVRKPRVVMYHGDIVGARLQNGMDVKSGGFALAKHELRAFDADYIACGHIHKPQEIMQNCFYSGSACPKDFGETHDAIFKIVEV